MVLIFISTQIEDETKYLLKRLFAIHREYIDDGFIGFRPPVAYADAIDKGEVIFAVDLNINGMESIIGFAHYRRLKNKTVRLYAIAIANEDRGRGVGSLILERLESCSGTHVKTEVRFGNELSLNFFKKNGYIVTGEKQKKNYRVYLLEKKITADRQWMYDTTTGKIVYKNSLRWEE